MRITLLQLDIHFGETAKNMFHVEQSCETAGLVPHSLVVLPEMWNTGYDLTRLAEIADEDGQETQRFLAGLAKKHQIYLVGGSVARRQGSEYYNTTYVYGPSGELLGSYDKVHLFRLMKEEQFLSAGDQPLVVDIAGTTVSPVICYDLRFPEWFRKQASELGTQLFVVPAQWPGVRIDAWRKLLQARAIENQAFVVGVNRVGEDPENQFGGHSLVVNPLGEILLELGEEEQTDSVTIDLAEIPAVRKEIPVFHDRRPELY
ncbi:carbon-nitrogen family hydrolase [Enterococcus sp. 669A]|uniref:Carbon-nitrogen family hydrolase n=1 Tax=Candidatus Enterococcus moelleringii TaxID=2815325 RepID=A0ABS3LCU6_9ENTE|nr:carbon-nitrogen family hydrolase [Enterococcus sp. 669A]MBO1307452.1 carbon-nitrogen family hydrolase [Enterococcus sp. 669A]